jgi:hypothetical protein
MKINNLNSPNGVRKHLIISRINISKEFFSLFFQNHFNDKYAFTLGKRKEIVFINYQILLEFAPPVAKTRKIPNRNLKTVRSK